MIESLAASTIAPVALDLGLQETLLREVEDIARVSPPHRYPAPWGQPMRVLVTGAGRRCWCVKRRGGALAYCYSETDHQGLPWPALPSRWCELASSYARSDRPWDTAVINWYPWEGSSKDSGKLGDHVDRTESERGQRCPVVTFSLGMPAMWAVWNDEDEASRQLLRSGQVTVLRPEDGTRWAKHSIERLVVEPEPMFNLPLCDRRGRPIAGRWSISVRVS